MWKLATWYACACLWLAAVRGEDGEREAAPVDPWPRFVHAVYNVSVPENSGARAHGVQPAYEAAAGLRLTRAHRHLDLRYRIRHADKERLFKLEERLVGDFCFLVVRVRANAGAVLNRERRPSYRLEVHAVGRAPGSERVLFEAETELHVTVVDTNDLHPLFYPTEYEATVGEDAPPYTSVARVFAEDADLGRNAQVYYSIAEGDGDGLFAVHPSTGVVVTTRPLLGAAGAYTVRLEARDRGPPPRAPSAAQAPLTVTVNAANKHAPHIQSLRPSPRHLALHPRALAVLTITDADEGEHGRIDSVTIVAGDPDARFTIVKLNTSVEWAVVTHRLVAIHGDSSSAEGGASTFEVEVEVEACDGGRPSRSARARVQLELPTGDARTPVFARALYEVRVGENAPPRTPLVRLKEHASAMGAYIEIVAGNENGEFMVNAETGMLYTGAPLDAELRTLYTLTVAAVGPAHQASAKVKITVVDANDNDPVFEESALQVSLDENAPAGTSVARATARDRDAGENGFVTYSIANEASVPFEVDAWTGVVRTRVPLDYESGAREWEVVVRASDWGAPVRRRAEARLTVQLRDLNDNRPQWERVACVGHVRATPGALLTLSAIDLDAGNLISYRIASGNEDGCFALEPALGVLSATCTLPPRASRTLNLTATDGTHFADLNEVRVEVLAGGQGRATGAGESFLCRETGAARLYTETLAAAERSRAQAALARPAPAPAHSHTPAPNVHAPAFKDFPVQVKVNESLSLGSRVVALTAADDDEGYAGVLVYAISGGDEEARFRIAPDTGELQLIARLDREREPDYLLNVTVYDLGVPARAASRLLPITVLDVNDEAPRWDRSAPAACAAVHRMPEDAANGSRICQLHAHDPDTGAWGLVHYELEGEGSGRDVCVERATGEVRVCGALDRETRARYSLVAVARDGGGLRALASFTLLVEDVNDEAPVFAQQMYEVRVREDVPVGSVLAVVQARDADSSALSYWLSSVGGSAGGDEALSVDAWGCVRVVRPLDYEERPEVRARVHVSDGVHEAWVELRAFVLDVEENWHSPVFGAVAYEGVVGESARAGTSVLRVHARDEDPHDAHLHYYLRDSLLHSYFTIDDQGVVRVSEAGEGALDADDPTWGASEGPGEGPDLAEGPGPGPRLGDEDETLVWMVACAHDNGAPPRHACVHVCIKIVDENDVCPVWEWAQYEARVVEGAPAGTEVARMRALDADRTPAQLLYRIVEGDPHHLFVVAAESAPDGDGGGGEVAVVRSSGRVLDREVGAQHALEVEAWDGACGGRARLHVTLLDLNDHAPAFTHHYYTFTVPVLAAPSTGAPGTAPAPALAPDGSGEGEWSAESEPPPQLQSHSQPDWDGEPESGLRLRLGQVMALDPDAGENGTVRYSVRAGGGAGEGAGLATLVVHPTSGALYLVRAPSAPDNAPWSSDAPLEGSVEARDGGGRVAVARVSVRPIAVWPPPTSAPTMRAPAAVTLAPDDGPGFLAAVVSARHPDGARLWYALEAGGEDGALYLGAETGELVVARALNASRLLNVSVTDGVHAAWASVRVQVAGDGAGGESLRWPRAHYHVEVCEGADAGTQVARLEAVGGAPPLLYGLGGAASPRSLSLLALDSLSGALSLRHALTSAWSAQHEVVVWARESGVRVVRVCARVTVTARACGGTAETPTWPRPLLQVGVSRTAVPGTLLARLAAAPYRPQLQLARQLRYTLAQTTGTGPAAAAHLLRLDGRSGRLYLAAPLPPGPLDYTAVVRAAPEHAPNASAPLALHLTLLDDEETGAHCKPCDVRAALAEVRALPWGAGSQPVCEGPGLWTWLQPGAAAAAAGLHLNPTTGVLVSEADRGGTITTALNNVTLLAAALGERGEGVACTVSVRAPDPLLKPRANSGAGTWRVERARVLEGRAGALVEGASGAAGAGALVLGAGSWLVCESDGALVVRVEPLTGALLAAASLDADTAPNHTLTLIETESGNEVLVELEVVDVDDEAPRLHEPGALVRVPLAPAASTPPLLRLAATDPDTPASRLRYSLAPSPYRNLFTVHAHTGALHLREQGAPGRYIVRAFVSDGVRTTEALDVALQLVAPNPPGPGALAFTAPLYHTAAPENTTRPQTLVVLDVVGCALNEHVRFQLLTENPAFELGVTSGALRSTHVPLDRELQARHELVVAAWAGERLTLARVLVDVQDVNDECPAWQYSDVQEAWWVGGDGAVLAWGGAAGVVGTVAARDRDAAGTAAGDVQYELRAGPADLFHVERSSGEVSLRRAVPPALYALQVGAHDAGAPPCAAPARTLLINVTAARPPAWLPSTPRALRLRADAETNSSSPLGVLAARCSVDADTDAEGEDEGEGESEVVYAVLAPPDRPHLLLANPLTGELSMWAGDGGEGQWAGEVLTRAYCVRTGSYNERALPVRVQPASSTPAQLQPARLEMRVREDVPPNHFIALFNYTAPRAAGDEDENEAASESEGEGEMECVLEGGVEALEVEWWEAGCYVRVSARGLAGLVRGELTAAVRARRRRRPDVTLAAAHLKLHVERVNMGAPEVVEGSVCAWCGGEGDRVLCSLAARDPDGDALQYLLLDHHRLLRLHPTTGIVRTVGGAEAWAGVADEVSARVAVCDGARCTRSVLRVRRERAGNLTAAPLAFSRALYDVQLPEDALPGAVVAEVSVSGGAGAGSTRLWVVEEGQESEGAGAWQVGDSPGSSSGSAVVVVVLGRARLDRERAATRTLTLHAADCVAHATATLRITLTDVNDQGPECMESAGGGASVQESTAAGTEVARVRVRDGDAPPHRRHRYWLSGPDAAHFVVAGADCQEQVRTACTEAVVRVAAPSLLDRERRAHYALQLHVQDVAPPHLVCLASLHLNVLDDDDNPPAFERAHYAVAVREDAALGAVVAVLRATDPDLGEHAHLRYELAHAELDSGPDPERPPFSIDAQWGVVQVVRALDREARAHYELVVIARHPVRADRSATASLSVTLLDVNDNAPEWEGGPGPYSVAVSELAGVGTQLLRLRAASADEGANAAVRYELLDGEGADAFVLDAATGVLSVGRALDYEAAPHGFLLRVRATDQGEPPLSATTTVNVTLLDANDNAPRFTQPSYEAEVREDAALASPLLQLIAEDRDSGANGRLSYSIEPHDGGAFSVDEATGLVTVTRALDRETCETHTLQVVARDHGLPVLSARAALVVRVIDVNDNPPELLTRNLTAVVREGAAPGEPVLTLQVRDRDAQPNGPPFAFDLRALDYPPAFTVGADGTIRTAARLSVRVRSEYALHVRVFDNGTPPLYCDAAVRVVVAARSQYPPVVRPLHVHVWSTSSVEGVDAWAGGPLGALLASDLDPYDTVRFTLVSPAPLAALFSLEADSGLLSAAPHLDPGEYALNVSASDGSFVSHALVTVRVERMSAAALAASVTLRLRAASPEQFVARHRRGFIRAVARALLEPPENVLLLSLQPSPDTLNMVAPHASLPRQRRHVPRDLDVLLAVKVSGSDSGFHAAETVRRRLNANLQELEESSKLVVEEIVRDACVGSEAACGQEACEESVQLLGSGVRVQGEGYVLVSGPWTTSARCVCGARAPAAQACRAARATRYDGGRYWQMALPAAAEHSLAVSLRFRTRAERGTLLQVAGSGGEWLVVEVVDGVAAARVQLGGGEGAARAGAGLSDGRWHALRLHRHHHHLRLAVDALPPVHAHAPPSHRLLDPGSALSLRLTVGAQLHRAAPYLPPHLEDAFIGCIGDLVLDDEPVQEQLVDDSAGEPCPDEEPTRVGACAALPCLHGGTCTPVKGEGEEYSCACVAGWGGTRCHVNVAPCLSQPCLHGGTCMQEGERWRCACPAGLHGARCGDGRWCASAPCPPALACEDHELAARCLCDPATHGVECERSLRSEEVRVSGVGAGPAWWWRVDSALYWWAGSALGLLLALGVACAALAARCTTTRRHHPRPLLAGTAPTSAPKICNVAAAADGKASAVGGAGSKEAAAQPALELNNMERLRSYGSAADQLELPPDYIRNLNTPPAPLTATPLAAVATPLAWADMMHLPPHRLHHKIHNDLKGAGATATIGGARRAGGAVVLRDPRTLGGYHWDCSDWLAGGGGSSGGGVALPYVHPHAHSDAGSLSLSLSHTCSRSGAGSGSASEPDPLPSEYEARCSGGGSPLRRGRTPRAASLLSMLEERVSLLGGTGAGDEDEDRGEMSLDGPGQQVHGQGRGDSGRASPALSTGSTRLCDIEDSDCDNDAPPLLQAHSHSHTHTSL